VCDIGIATEREPHTDTPAITVDGKIRSLTI